MFGAKKRQNWAFSPLMRRLFRTLIYLCMAWGCLCMSPSVAAQISEQDVYNNPDDHELNLAYATQQIQKGEMLDAGSALERMLFANPNWHSARLLYAAVLYRLDDQQAALRELSLLEGKELNDEQTAKLETYKTDFQRPPQPIQLSSAASVNPGFDGSAPLISRDYIQANVSLQARADSNAGNALTDANFGFNDEGDVSLALNGKIRAFVPATKSVSFHAEAGGLIRRHETFENVDYDVLDGSVGVSFSDENRVVALDVDAREININGERYLHQIGPRLTFSHQLSETTYNTISVSVLDQDYDNISTTTLEDERSGTKTTFQTAILHKINKRATARIAAGYEFKSAGLDAFAYDGPILAGALNQQITDDVYVKADGKVRWLNYDGGFEDDIAGRNEARVSGRLAFGKHLNSDNSIFSKKTDSTQKKVEIGFNYNIRGSNISDDNFENFGVDVRFSVGF